MYPMWIRIDYKELGERMGYTGSVISRVDLVNLMIRLDIHFSDIDSFEINGSLQSRKILHNLFIEIDRTSEGVKWI